jgi:hypothetical protein
MNKKVIAAALFIIILCCSFTLLEKESMLLLKFLFDSGALMTISIIFVIVSVFCYTCFTPANINNDIPVFRYGGLWILECILNISTYSAVTSTAVNLLKGIYLQKFYHQDYFTGFESLDIYTMTGVSSMLLWFSLFKCWQMFQEAYSYNAANEVSRS